MTEVEYIAAVTLLSRNEIYAKFHRRTTKQENQDDSLCGQPKHHSHSQIWTDNKTQ